MLEKKFNLSKKFSRYHAYKSPENFPYSQNLPPVNYIEPSGTLQLKSCWHVLFRVGRVGKMPFDVEQIFHNFFRSLSRVSCP